MSPRLLLFGWLAAISLVSIGVTAWDKWAAKSRSPRVAERTLLWLAVLGGGVAMYLTMLLVRHKTLKAKFMVGIPAIVLAQAALWYFLK